VQAVGLTECGSRTAEAWRPLFESALARHLEHEPSGHDAHHARRVCRIALQLAASIDADADIVEAAALLHDLGHHAGRQNHAERSAEIAKRLLDEAGFPESKREAVLECIRLHEWRPDRSGDPVRPSLEYQAFADADRLDALGAVGIARVFTFGGAHGRPIWEPDGTPTGAEPTGRFGPSSIQHFYDKLLLLPSGMYTTAGRALAQRRLKVIERFLKAFHAEWAGHDLAGGPDATERIHEANGNSRRVPNPGRRQSL